MIYTEYKAIKFTLVTLCVLILIVGTTRQFWPITSWPLYAFYYPKFPSSSATLFQVIVISKNNETYELPLTDILAEEHLGDLTLPLIQKIVDNREQKSSYVYRDSLISLIQKTLPNVDIKKVEIWQFEWTVNPQSLPPLNYDNPSKKALIDTLVID